MYKNVSNLGVVLNKTEQLKVMGGFAPDCEPGLQDPIICIPGVNCP